MLPVVARQHIASATEQQTCIFRAALAARPHRGLTFSQPVPVPCPQSHRPVAAGSTDVIFSIRAASRARVYKQAHS